jgi:hypothetical protein
MGVRLDEEVVCLFLHSRNRIRACHEAERRLVQACEVNDRVGEFPRVTALLPIHAFPRSDGTLAALAIVFDLMRGVLRRIGREQFRAKKAGLDEHCVDAERSDLGRQRLDPTLESKLGS